MPIFSYRIGQAGCAFCGADHRPLAASGATGYGRSSVGVPWRLRVFKPYGHAEFFRTRRPWRAIPRIHGCNRPATGGLSMFRSAAGPWPSAPAPLVLIIIIMTVFRHVSAASAMTSARLGCGETPLDRQRLSVAVATCPAPASGFSDRSRACQRLFLRRRRCSGLASPRLWCPPPLGAGVDRRPRWLGGGRRHPMRLAGPRRSSAIRSTANAPGLSVFWPASPLAAWRQFGIARCWSSWWGSVLQRPCGICRQLSAVPPAAANRGVYGRPLGSS